MNKKKTLLITTVSSSFPSFDKLVIYLNLGL